MIMFIVFALLGMFISWKRRIPFPFGILLGAMAGVVLSAVFILFVSIVQPDWAYNFTATAVKAKLLESPACKDRTCNLAYETTPGIRIEERDVKNISILNGKPTEPISISMKKKHITNSKKVLLEDISELFEGKSPELFIIRVSAKPTLSLLIFPPLDTLRGHGFLLSLPEDLYKKAMG